MNKRAEKKKIDDEVRIKVLECLFEKGCLTPNLEKIQRLTGYHKATIKSSIDFLVEKGVIECFEPKVNVKTYGFNVTAFSVLNADLTNKKALNKMLKNIEKDSNLINLTSVIGPGNWNLMTSHLYHSIDEFNQGLQKRYYEKMPELYDFIKDRMIFYRTDPKYTKQSTSRTAMKILRKNLEKRK